MSLAEFDEERLASELAPLSRRHRAAFAAAVCERLLPNYAAFSRETGWGDAGQLRAALDEVWTFVRGAPVQALILREHLSRVGRATPDTEDFDTYLVSPALDAGAAVAAALECVLTGDAAKAVEAASYARDTVDMYVQERENLAYDDPEFEEKILNHPLMVREMARQRANVLELQRTETPDEGVIARLRAPGEGLVSSIGLE